MLGGRPDLAAEDGTGDPMSGVVQYMRGNTRVGAAVGAALLVVGMIAIWMQTSGGSRVVSPGQAFYTTDEGATLFTDSANHLPPFDHDGKEAVRAAVFSCDSGQHRWVQYLLKYSPEALSSAAQMKAAGAQYISLGLVDALVKRPGDKAWVRASESSSVMTPRCPDGQPGPPLAVPP